MNASTDKITLTLIGCGKMGGAMMRGWLNTDIIDHTHIYDPHAIDQDLKDHSHITAYGAQDSLSVALRSSDVIILAVKPQAMAEALSALKAEIPPSATILSIAAGLDSAFFADIVGPAQPFIRAMPNTPCAIGKGISALYANQHSSAVIKSKVEKLFKALGDAFWLDDEAQMNAVTAISGSGPAYVFHFIEALTNAAEELGFTADIASRLARQTVIGAASLADAEAAIPASLLRQNVTSPAGTTEAGLKVLMNENGANLKAILNATAQAALQRAIELGSKD
jgi:pyrroline-5-carboxylate reductase